MAFHLSHELDCFGFSLLTVSTIPTLGSITGTELPETSNTASPVFLGVDGPATASSSVTSSTGLPTPLIVLIVLTVAELLLLLLNPMS